MSLVQLEGVSSHTPQRATEGIEVTPSAVERVKQLLAAHPEKAGQGLRVYVASGGCAGYSYGMAFDSPADNDTVLEVDGLKVLLDADSLPWLKNARVDYTESMMGSGFSITNPNAEAGCGCGHSFSKG